MAGRGEVTGQGIPAFVGAEALRRRVPMALAVDALERAFGSDRRPDVPRTHVGVGPGSLLLMPALGAGGVGVKLVTVAPSNPGRGLPLVHALYVLFDPVTLAPVSVVDGSALTALRTSAVSALATRHLARADAARLVIFGAGVQGSAHLEAMCAVRPVEEVVVVSRSEGRADALVGAARRRGLRAEVGGPEAVGRADLVCTCTTSASPLFDGRLVLAGTHVNAVGAFQPDAREVDDALVGRARIVVETRAAAMAEAGDLLIPMAAGVIGPDAVVADLGEVVRGTVVRRTGDEVTLFKSVGVAFEDLAVATAALAGEGA